jgi:serine/threonine protein kinase
LLGSGVYGSVYLANDVLTQKQVACKIVDLRRKAMKPDGQDTLLDGAHRMEVQAFAEQENGVTEVRKKLIREIEILSKLSHV